MMLLTPRDWIPFLASKFPIASIYELVVFAKKLNVQRRNTKFNSISTFSSECTMTYRDTAIRRAMTPQRKTNLKKFTFVVVAAVVTISSFAQTLASDGTKKRDERITGGGLNAENCTAIKESKKRLICFDTLSKQAASERNIQGTAKNESVTEVAPKVTSSISSNKVLIIDAGVVYASGDVKPVARTSFYILNESLGDILKSANLNVTANTVSQEHDTLVNIGFFGTVHVMIDKLTSINDTSSPAIQKAKSFYSQAITAIEPHIVQRGITDFSGKLRFDSLPSGVYYVMGVYKTPKGSAIWNLRVVLNDQETKIILDQNNAASVN